MERAKAGDPRRDVVSKVIDERGGRDFVRMLQYAGHSIHG